MVKGQVSIFIALGIIILFSLVFGYYTQVTVDNTNLLVNDDFSAINDYVEGCYDLASVKAGYILSKNAGKKMINSSIFGLTYMDFFSSDVNVVYNQFLSPRLNFVENRSVLAQNLNFILHDEFNSCIDSFRSFRDFGFDFDTQMVNFNSSVYDDYYMVGIDYYLLITKGSTVYYITELPFNKVDLKLGKYYDAAFNLNKKTELNPSYISFSDIKKLEEQDNIVVHVKKNDYGLIYFLLDTDSTLDKYKKYYGETYAFIFAQKFI